MSMTDPITKAKMYYNAGKHYITKNYLISKLENDEPADVSRLHEILDRYSEEDEVFVHVGLSDIKAVFHENPYELLLNLLDAHFDSILAPGFTPSFRQSGVYHKLYSRPEFGMFSKLFLEDADYRTDDPLHSIFVKGDYRFEECNHRNTFSRDGCWDKLDKDNMLYMNIGTPWIVTTQHHYVEHYYDVPYNSPKKYEGHIYYDETEGERIEQISYQYDEKIIHRNFLKSEKCLYSSGVLDRFFVNGLKILFFRARDMRKALKPKIDNDNYYLVD